MDERLINLDLVVMLEISLCSVVQFKLGKINEVPYQQFKPKIMELHSIRLFKALTDM